MEDQRTEEFECVAAIFPEIEFNPTDQFRASIELSVNPRTPVTVAFPTAFDGVLNFPTPPLSTNSGNEEGDDAIYNPQANNTESYELTYLPSLQLHISLPEGYPETEPPKFELSTNPAWLPRARLDKLEADGVRMWEESGHDLVVFAYIDSLQQGAENAFGYGEEGKMLEISQDDKISLLDFDIKAIQAAFNKGTYDCGVCLNPKKGFACHKMIDCGHVFCIECLQDFYNNAIKEGDLISVRCLAPNCAKERAVKSTKKTRKPKTQLSPSELLQIPLEHDVVTRFVKLKHKAQLESDKNTVYCPRAWCNGAARSKKYRKPEGLEDDESSDDESDTEAKGKDKGFVAGADLIAICEDCSYAFCSRCLQGWHGEFKACAPKREKEELSEEEKASLEYMQLHTTPCPTCAAPVQKTHGCNHMICFRCNSHFCYLCSAWLEPANPYKHFNQETTGCFQRLWELEAGDGDDVGRGFDGGVQLEPAVEILEEEEIVVPEVEEPEPEIPEPEEEIEQGERQEVERQAPLVLRLNQLRPAAQPIPAVPDAPQAPHGLANRGHRQNQGRGNGAPRGRFGGLNRREVPRQAAGIGRGRGDINFDLDDQHAANQAWVQRFVQMALDDEEDQLEWDDDDEENHAAWEIPVR
ncbi:hypothetical protein SBOR_8694 [Sclerotinia borealis F-4128]|uniref:RBR-type E3 ubiquitin transferase n=1 Tax=Sclerotinia borealis (strain F-4128) TaxID=1432307 RepID=W9C2B1_SCLBF|nr:hypothetical protein SBOR_8694 [Sclerotinia borealis F-4128]